MPFVLFRPCDFESPFYNQQEKYIHIINEWCQRMYIALYRNDKVSAKCLLMQALGIDHEYNPLLVALSNQDDRAIYRILTIMKHLWSDNKETIANILSFTRCPLFPIISYHQVLVDIVETMIRRGVDVNDRGPNKLPALHAVIFGGDPQRAEILLRLGIDVNCRDPAGNTPLHTASLLRDGYEITKLLLDNGADVNALNAHGHTPLYYAYYHRHWEAKSFWLLLENGAVLKPQNLCGRAAAHFAPDRSRRDAVHHFLDCEIDVRAKDFSGNTVLHLACVRYDEELIEELLQRDADLYCKNKNGETPLLLYLENINRDLDDRFRTRLLTFYFNHGGDVNVILEPCLNLSILRYCYLICLTQTGEDVLTLSEALCWEHITMLDSLGFPVDLARMVDTSRLNYFKSCKKELLTMKTETLYGNVTFFNILTDGEAKMLTYVRNQSLVEAYENTDIFRMFPYYSQQMASKFHNAIEKQTLMKNASISLNYILNFIIPLDLIEEKIIPCMNVSEMLELTYKQE